MAKKNTLETMVEKQLVVVESDAAANVAAHVASAKAAETDEAKIQALKDAIASQTSVVNATYSYAFDAVVNGGPTPLYVFTKDVRNAIRSELKALLPTGTKKAEELRAKFDSIR